MIFALVTLAHGWRLIKGSEVIVGSHHLPLMLSVVAVVVGAILSIWMWKLSSRAARS
ncbi:MAG: hypothetical protein ACXV97_09230 [Chthoniobacterales bacterium]